VLDADLNSAFLPSEYIRPINMVTVTLSQGMKLWEKNFNEMLQLQTFSTKLNCKILVIFSKHLKTRFGCVSHHHNHLKSGATSLNINKCLQNMAPKRISFNSSQAGEQQKGKQFSPPLAACRIESFSFLRRAQQHATQLAPSCCCTAIKRPPGCIIQRVHARPNRERELIERDERARGRFC
jgi:hypothetical protein